MEEMLVFAEWIVGSAAFIALAVALVLFCIGAGGRYMMVQGLRRWFYEPPPSPKLSPKSPSASAAALKSLREELRSNLSRVIDMFREWDEDKSGGVGRAEMRRALAELGYDAPPPVVAALFDTFDRDGTGSIRPGRRPHGRACGTRHDGVARTNDKAARARPAHT